MPQLLDVFVKEELAATAQQVQQLLNVVEMGQVGENESEGKLLDDFLRELARCLRHYDLLRVVCHFDVVVHILSN